MAYKIRAIFNSETNVIRDISINKSATLEVLHNTIKKSFGFTANEMAAFYISDEDWNQGEEFPLFDMSEGLDSKISMRDITIENVLRNENDKLIYVYDFFSMWSFYIELIETKLHSNDMDLPNTIFSLGSIPNNAPDINFEFKNESEEIDEDDEIDEFDFDQYQY